MDIKMIPETNISYASYLDELQIMLAEARIVSSHQAITGEANRKENRTDHNSELKPVVGRVIVYMEDHLTEQLSLDTLADEVQLSKYQLIRRFREETGVTPWKFLIAKRINRVKEFLKDGIPPSQAAVKAGFYDQSHLTKIFREEVGSTPREYQEKFFKNRN